MLQPSKLTLAGVLAAAAIVFVPAEARADEPAPSASPEAKEAEGHFTRGLKLFDESDYKLALVEFERSYELVPNYRVLYNIGEVEFQLGSFAKARRTLSRYLELGGERIPPNRRAQVEKDLEALKLRTALLLVGVDAPGAEITVDGERLGVSPLGDKQLVDAGAHRIEVKLNGYAPSSEPITLVGGDDKRIDVHLTPLDKPQPTTRVIEVHDAPGLGPVWIGWGLTVALAAATVGTAVAWQNADGKLADLKGTSSSQTERESQARSVDTLRTVTFVLGGTALVAAGVSLFVTLRRSGDSAKSTKAAIRMLEDPTAGLRF